MYVGPLVSKQLLYNHFTGCSPDIEVYNFANATRKTERYDKQIQCLFTVGSIIQMARSHDHIWGTGINPYRQLIDRNGTKVFKLSQTLHVYATRGPRTWQLFQQHEPSSTINEANGSIVRDQIVKDTNQAFGDPGFLTPTLFPQYLTKRSFSSSSSETTIHYCIVPHYQDLRLPQIQELNMSSPFFQKPMHHSDATTMIHIISPHNSWENVLQQISTLCHYVASSSLHGLIVSEAIGIPTLWFQIPDQKTAMTEGNFKYNDYYDSIGISNIEPMSNINYEILTNSKSYKQPLSDDIRQKFANTMIHSFPYHLFESFCY
jgi:Polysaccharide pyruvyl transferase